MDVSLNKVIDTFKLEHLRDQILSLKEKGSEPERLKAAIERILRKKAITYGNSGALVSEANKFVEFVISLAKEEICAKTLTIQILQDIFDVSTTARSEEFFGIVETHIGIWKKPFFFESCKNMILRMCNDLLKRLSRTIDTTFCGRILILLAKSLPLNEKSGLNLTGQFNTQNVTAYDREKKELFDDSQQQGLPDDDMEMGEIRENKDANGAIPTDYNLYIKFWDLQRLFSNPNLLFEMNQFKQFEKDISDIFSIFLAYKLEKQQRQQEQSPSDTREATETNCVNVNGGMVGNGCIDNCDANKQINGKQYKMETDDGEGEDDVMIYNANECENQLADEQTFFAKYLTSQKIFPLQLADSQFRRYFLLQYLIVSNYLASKAKLKEAIDLTPVQETALRELTDKCYVLLRETHPHGSHFADSLRKILGREKQWSNWKNEGCPDLVGQSSNSPERKCAMFKRKPMRRYDSAIMDLGNRELTRLWNIERDNPQACRSSQRKCIPMLRPFLEEALDEMDPEQQVEEQYQSVNDEKYQWMASRFLLFNSDQYINLAVQEANAKTPDKPEKVANMKVNGTILRKAIQMTAENMPDLRPRVEQVLERIDQKVKKEIAARQAEEARLAAKTRELEKRIKEEEERDAIETMVKKEREETTNSLTEVKKEVKAAADQHPHTPPSSRRGGTGERSERQRPTPSDANEKEEVTPPPRKRIKQEEEKESAPTNNNNASHSSRRKEKEEPTPEHDQPKERSGSKKVEEKERKGGGGDDGDKERKSRKRHVEKSAERKMANSGSISGGGTSSSGKGEKERKGSSGGGRSSTDRDHRNALENDRVKKRK